MRSMICEVASRPTLTHACPSHCHCWPPPVKNWPIDGDAGKSNMDEFFPVVEVADAWDASLLGHLDDAPPRRFRRPLQAENVVGLRDLDDGVVVGLVGVAEHAREGGHPSMVACVQVFIHDPVLEADTACRSVR